MQDLKKRAESIRKQKSGVLQKESSILKELRSIEKQISEKEKDLDTQKRNLEQKEKELKTVKNSLVSARLNYEKTRMILNKRLRAMYMLGYQEKHLSYLKLFLSDGDISDVTHKYKYITSISTADRNLLDKAKAQKEELSFREKLVENKKEEIAQNKNITEKAKNDIENKKKSRSEVLVKVQKSKIELTKAQAEIESSINKMERLIAQLRDNQDKKEKSDQKTGKKDVSKKPYQSPSGGKMGNLMWPVSGQIIENAAPSMKGVTIKANYGTDIKCVKDGKVAHAGWFDGVGFGQIVIIDHGNRYYTLYAHASAILVKVDQIVSKGQTIAKIGDTGSLRGPMLYFEVWSGARALPTRPLLSD
ncbi:MAG: peptidoglycan DD-metalloendopeptidase family protein [Patescibacteria group bacterium]